MTKYYELIHDNRVFYTVYDEQEIIRAFCEMVNGYGIDPEQIITKTYINGREVANNDK